MDASFAAVDSPRPTPACQQAVQRGDAQLDRPARGAAHAPSPGRVWLRGHLPTLALAEATSWCSPCGSSRWRATGQAARHHVVGQRRDLHARHRALRPRAAARAAVRADGGQVVRQGRLQLRARRRRGRAEQLRSEGAREARHHQHAAARCSAPRRTSTPSPARADLCPNARTSAAPPSARFGAPPRDSRGDPNRGAASASQRRSATEIATASRGWRSRARCRASSGSVRSPRAPAATA